MRDPRTAEEWQAAVDGANFAIGIRADDVNGILARGGLEVDLPRCEELLARGRAIGFEPCSVEEYVAREISS